MKAICGVLLFVFWHMAASTSAIAQEKVVLQLRFDHQFQFAGYYAAMWKGFYEEAGLDVEIRPGVRSDGSLVDVTSEIASKRADFGIAAGDALVALDNGLLLVLAACIFCPIRVKHVSPVCSKVKSASETGPREGKLRVKEQVLWVIH